MPSAQLPVRHTVANPIPSPAGDAAQATGLARQLGATGSASIVPVMQETAETQECSMAICMAVQTMFMDYMKDARQKGDFFCLNEKRVKLVATLFGLKTADFTALLEGNRKSHRWLALRTPEQFGELLSRFIDTVNHAPKKSASNDLYRKGECPALVKRVLDGINPQLSRGRLVLSEGGIDQSPRVVWHAEPPLAAAQDISEQEPPVRPVVPATPPRPVAVRPVAPALVAVPASGFTRTAPPVTPRKTLGQATQWQVVPAPVVPVAVVTEPPRAMIAEPVPTPMAPESHNQVPDALASRVLEVLQDYLTTPGLHSQRSHLKKFQHDLAFPHRDDSGQTWQLGDLLECSAAGQLTWKSLPSREQLNDLPEALSRSGHSARSSLLLGRLNKVLVAETIPGSVGGGMGSERPYAEVLNVFENYLRQPKQRKRLMDELPRAWQDDTGQSRSLRDFIRVDGASLQVEWVNPPDQKDLAHLFNGCMQLGHRRNGTLLPGLQQAIGNPVTGAIWGDEEISKIASRVTSRPLLKKAVQDCLRQMVSGKLLNADDQEVAALVAAYADQEMARLGVEEGLSKNYRPADWEIHYERKFGFLPHSTTREVSRRAEVINREQQRLGGLAKRFVDKGAGSEGFLGMLDTLFGELHKSTSPVVKNLNPQRLQNQKAILLQGFQEHWGKRYVHWVNEAEVGFAKRLRASRESFAATRLGGIKKLDNYPLALGKVNKAFSDDSREAERLHRTFETVGSLFPSAGKMKENVLAQLKENTVSPLEERVCRDFTGLVGAYENDLKAISGGSDIEIARKIRACSAEARGRLKAMLIEKQNVTPEVLSRLKLDHAQAVAAVKKMAVVALNTIKQRPFSFKSFIKGLSFKGPLRSIATVLGGGLTLVGLVAMALPSAQVLAIVCLISGASLLTYGVGGAVLASLARTGHSVEKFFVTLGARWQAYRAERRYQKLLQKQQKLQDKMAKQAGQGKVAA